MTALDKAEILKLVRKNPLSVQETLGQLGIPRSTYYRWKERFERSGIAGLQDHKPSPQTVWNRLTNLRPIDVYEGRGERILQRRQQLKQKTMQRRREENLMIA